MDSKKLVKAIKEIRRYLLIHDEVIKAVGLLELFIDDFPQLLPELETTKKMIIHLNSDKEYTEVYANDPVEDASTIEPYEIIANPGIKYFRYSWICDELKKYQPDTYADLACYIGTLPIWAAGHGIKAYGVDMTKASIAEAKRRADKEHKEVEFVAGNLMDFKTKVNIVSAFEVIEHVPDDKAFIKHLLSIGKDWVYITTPNLSYGDGEGNLGHWDFGGGTRGHVRIYNENTLKQLIESCGGKVGDEFVKDNLIHVKFSHDKK
jgi:predicted RNA methylase